MNLQQTLYMDISLEDEDVSSAVRQHYELLIVIALRNREHLLIAGINWYYVVHPSTWCLYHYTSTVHVYCQMLALQEKVFRQVGQLNHTLK